MEQLWTSPIPEKPWVNTSLFVLCGVYDRRAVLKHSSVVHGDRDSLGERKKLPDGKLGEYEYVKYKDLYPIVVQLGRSLRKQFPFLQRQGHIGFYGRNCKNIQLYSLAMQSQDQTTVPVYDTLGTNAVKFIVTHCEMSVIAVTEEKLPSLQELLRNSARKKSHIEGETCISGVVLLNVSPFSPALKAFKEAIPQSIKVIHFEDVNSPSSPHRQINCVPYEDPVVQKEDDWVPSGDSILYILYTSGTTGQPKGVMIKHAAMLTISSSFIHNIVLSLSRPHP